MIKELAPRVRKEDKVANGTRRGRGTTGERPGRWDYAGCVCTCEIPQCHRSGGCSGGKRSFVRSCDEKKRAKRAEGGGG